MRKTFQRAVTQILDLGKTPFLAVTYHLPSQSMWENLVACRETVRELLNVFSVAFVKGRRRWWLLILIPLPVEALCQLM
uniref:Uncharacterized protein n=1 Tax=Rhizophora mucronata TaxID=61149 RepID=A0A2P2MXD5_RHIMU